MIQSAKHATIFLLLSLGAAAAAWAAPQSQGIQAASPAAGDAPLRLRLSTGWAFEKADESAATASPPRSDTERWLQSGEKFALAGTATLPERKIPLPEKGKAAESTTYAFGAGATRMPRWLGASGMKNFAVPFIDINWQDRIEFSTNNGLIVDLIHDGPWHGGIVGTMMWGRSRSDLGALADRVPTLINTLQGGVYLEYALTKELSVGTRLRHDIQTGAAYGDIYADLDLPSPGLIEHSINVSVEAMNRTAMRRFFGLSPETAAALGTTAYDPGSGYGQTSLAYNLFVPTSQSTGIAAAAGYIRLAREAADSPLVRNFGNPNQRNFMAAFVYHF